MYKRQMGGRNAPAHAKRCAVELKPICKQPLIWHAEYVDH